MGVLEDICEESLQATGFFHGGPARLEVGYVRLPVLRDNTAELMIQLWTIETKT